MVGDKANTFVQHMIIRKPAREAGVPLNVKRLIKVRERAEQLDEF